MNIAAQLTPEDPQVQRLREASDCVPILFGLAYGTATIENALAQKARLLSNYNEPKVLISKVRSVVLHDYYYLFFGSRCIEVTGE
jgi:hypothetical protein